MFRDDEQVCRAVRIFLAGVFHDVEPLWTKTGPTKLALRYLKESPLSHGEHIMLQVAFDFWNQQGGAKFADILTVLDQALLTEVFELSSAVANGPNAVDAWIARRATWPLRKDVTR